MRWTTRPRSGTSCRALVGDNRSPSARSTSPRMTSGASSAASRSGSSGVCRSTSVPLTDYTIGIDTIDVMVAKMQEFAGWPIYKIKLGTPRRPEIVAELRRHTDAVFRVDANCGWTPRRRSATPRRSRTWASSSSSSRCRRTMGRDAAGLPPVGPAADCRRELPGRSRTSTAAWASSTA